MKLSIGQVSKLFNITKDTLRHYDKLGLLKPDVNKNNGYRYYSREHIERLNLILYTRDLDISLSNIKNTIESENINEYKKLVNKQQELIKEKIDYLIKKQKQLLKLSNTLDNIIEAKNEYNFENIGVYEDTFILYKIDIKDILSLVEGNNYTTYIDEEMYNIEDDYLLSGYKLNEENILIEDESHIYVKDFDNRYIIDKYIEEGLNITEKKISGKFIKFNFSGTENELQEYIVSLSTYFDLNLDEDILINYYFYIPKKDEEEICFSKILINVK